jgi:hypothetical protein
MALSDFLNNGQIPAGSAVKSTTSQTVLPEWYTNYAMQLLSNQGALQNRPYETAPMPRVAGFTPGQQQGFGMTGTAATAYQPGLTAATDVTKAAIAAPGSLSVAQPYLTQAGQSTVANIGTYMNPFTDQVVNRIGELGQRNLRENFLPEVEGRYVKAGQLGFGPRDENVGATPSGMMLDLARTVRDTNSDILGRQAEALRGGFTEAAGLSAADLSRIGTLANTIGNFQSSDLTRALSGAEQLGGLASTEQALGLKGAQAVTGVGAEQQALNQKNLDIAYGDFLKQQGYPQEQIDKALGTFRGLAGAAPGATIDEGIVPSGVDYKGQPTTAATIAGALSGLGGVLAGAKEGSALSKLLGFG